MTLIDEYIKYHQLSAEIGDIDPSYSMLRYVCDRFELNVEQRYWLAFIYALTYCGASVYYVYNEFPDFENLDTGRLNRWWYGGGRAAIICQTDARWRRSRNQFVDAIECYRNWVGKKTQHEHFSAIAIGKTPEERYDRLLSRAKSLYTFGQFTLFLYLEALHTITPLDLEPTDLDLNKAWSCRNGLLYAYGLPQWITETEAPTPIAARAAVTESWLDLRARLARLPSPPTVWQTETILCAYRKYRRTLEGKAGATGKRWIGFYLDRQVDEIAKMEDHVRDGVCWNVLWQYREETYRHEFCAEKHGWVTPLGIGAGWKTFGVERTREMLGDAL
jgi:hypothetical protein